MAKHSWTEQELWVVSVCYKENLPIEIALRLTNTTNAKSMEMRYRNCLFLDKGRVENALSHASSTHQRVWDQIEELYSEIQPFKPVVPEEVETFIFLCLFVAIAICLVVGIHALSIL